MVIRRIIFALALMGKLVAQAQLDITQQPTNQVAINGGTAVLSVSVSGTGPFTYQWQFNGSNVTSFVSTIAGNGLYGYSGDGGSATNAELKSPAGVAVDSRGNVYIADATGNRIRKLSTNGIITTVAGNGTNGYAGDGGQATNAELYFPFGVSVDNQGDVFVADYYNQRIREIGTNGIIKTVAGNGTNGYTGDGGQATNAELSYPSGMAVDSRGNIYVVDVSNQRLREVATNGIITTLAGNGNSGFSGDGGPATNAELYFPYGVAVDSQQNVYIAEEGNQCIRKVGTNGIITTFAGNGTNGYAGDGGLATNAELSFPEGVAVDNQGNVYVADSQNAGIREISTNGIITTKTGIGLAGYSGDEGPTPNAQLNEPLGLAVDGYGNMYIADTDNWRVREVGSNNLSTLTFANMTTNNLGNYRVVVSDSFGSVTSAVAVLNMSPFFATQPLSQTALKGGSVSFTSTAGGTAPLGFQWAFNGNGISSAAGSIYQITNATLDEAGQYAVTVTNQYGGVISTNATLTVAYICQQPTNQIMFEGGTAIFNTLMSAPGPFSYQWQFDGTNLPTSDIITTMAGNGSGGYSGDGIPAAGAELYDPADVAVDSQGNVYIADSINARVRKVSTNGIIATIAGNGTTGFAGDGGPATNAELNSPSGVAVDSQGNVYIADEDNQRIRKVGTNGIIATLAGNSFNGYSGDGGQAANAELNSPSGVAVDSQGNAYIADAGNSRIREVATNGIITTMAGNGTNGYAGDGGSATNAELNGPASVALDGNGNVYIADANNACVREVRKNGIITTVAGNGMTGYSGDDDVATNAELSFPEGVVVDGYGNLYIADADNSVIREVGQNGIITTVAGNGAAGYSGDNTNATETALDFPEGVAVDNQENLYIADLFNQRVRKVTDVNVSWPFTSALAVGNISSSNAGSYSLVISNSSGSITSSIASLTIVPLLIAPQPQNAEIVQSSNATFSVAASGVGPFGYQWQYNGTNLANGGQIGGSLTANLNISATTPGNAGNYQVIVTNIYGAVTSTVATLTILPPPQPAPVFGNSPDWGNSFEVSWAPGISSGGAVGFTPLQNITLSGVTVWLSYYTGQYGQTNIVAIYNNALSSSAPTNRPGAQITALRGPLPNDGTLAPFTFAYSSGQNVLRTNQEYWLLIEGNGTNPNIEVTSYWDGGGAPAGDVAYDGSVSLAGGSFEPSSVMPAFTINGTLPPPTVTARSFRGRIILTWPVGLNQIYQVQYATNIFQPTWVNLGNPIITTNYILSVPDAANGSQRFYRILQE